MHFLRGESCSFDTSWTNGTHTCSPTYMQSSCENNTSIVFRQSQLYHFPLRWACPLSLKRGNLGTALSCFLLELLGLLLASEDSWRRARLYTHHLALPPLSIHGKGHCLSKSLQLWSIEVCLVSMRAGELKGCLDSNKSDREAGTSSCASPLLWCLRVPEFPASFCNLCFVQLSRFFHRLQ